MSGGGGEEEGTGDGVLVRDGVGGVGEAPEKDGAR